MLINWQAISPEALDNIIEEFILREGTDYGVQELSFATKKKNLLTQIKNGDVVIEWSELNETITLKDRNSL